MLTIKILILTFYIKKELFYCSRNEIVDCKCLVYFLKRKEDRGDEEKC